MKSFYLYLLIAFSANTFAQIPGTLNAAFSENGWDTIYGNDNGFEITKTLLQADGKILVCAEGSFSNEAHQAIIVRYTPNGLPDPEFGGGDGMIRSRDDENINLFTRAYGMALQSNGKIIVAGDQLYNSERIFRLNADGTLDATFGTDGVVDINRPNSEFIYHVVVQSDDKIIVCGKESRFVSGVLEPHVFLWRFTADGAMDMSFGNAGVVSYNSQAWLGTFETYLVINDLIVLPNDDIIVNQSFTNYPNNFVMLSKLDADGAFDPSFGIAGHSTKSARSNDGVYTYSSAAVQENGSVISTFTTRDTINLTYTESVFRVDAQGQADPSLNLNIGIPEYFPIKTKILVSDNLFYYFRKSDYQNGYSYDVIHCYDLNGIPVNAFGIDGVGIINQNDIPASATSFATVDDNGDIYISSGTPDPDNTDNLLFLTSQVTGAEMNVSTNERLPDEIIAVYPNPSSGIFYLKSISNTSGNLRIEVVNSQGQTLFSNPDFELNETINLSNMPAGLYFLKITSNNESCTLSMINQ